MLLNEIILSPKIAVLTDIFNAKAYAVRPVWEVFPVL